MATASSLKTSCGRTSPVDVVDPAAVAPVRAVAAVKVADRAAKVVAPVDLPRKVAAVRAVGLAALLPKDAVKAVPVVKAANAPVGRSSSRE
jgi:hypothetical protein